MTEKQGYEPPALAEIGSLHELTLDLDKVGGKLDGLEVIVPGLTGSFVEDP